MEIIIIFRRTLLLGLLTLVVVPMYIYTRGKFPTSESLRCNNNEGEYARSGRNNNISDLVWTLCTEANLKRVT